MGNINGQGKIEFYDQRKTIERKWNNICMSDFAAELE
jgi:hypothetical protein